MPTLTLRTGVDPTIGQMANARGGASHGPTGAKDYSEAEKPSGKRSGHVQAPTRAGH
jgi:hypothetical protein